MLVADQNNGSPHLIAIRIITILHAFHKIVLPLFDSFVALPIGYVEYNDATVGASIECIAQALESLLASCIPYLKRYDLT